MSKKDVEALRGVIFCCHGGSCTRAGARTVEKALRAHAREAGLKDGVRFVRAACTGLCKSAPIVIVCANPSPTEDSNVASTCGAHWKREARPEQAPKIFEAHFANQQAPLAAGSAAKKNKKVKKRKRD